MIRRAMGRDSTGFASRLDMHGSSLHVPAVADAQPEDDVGVPKMKKPSKAEKLADMLKPRLSMQSMHVHILQQLRSS